MYVKYIFLFFILLTTSDIERERKNLRRIQVPLCVKSGSSYNLLFIDFEEIMYRKTILYLTFVLSFAVLQATPRVSNKYIIVKNPLL